MKSAPVAPTPTRTFVHAAAFKIPKSPAALQDRPGVLRLNVRGGRQPEHRRGRGTLVAEDEGREQEQLTLGKIK